MKKSHIHLKSPGTNKLFFMVFLNAYYNLVKNPYDISQSILVSGGIFSWT
jgi:hypothetical protein